MAGTREQGLKAAAKNLQKDPDFYKKIGAKGGAKSRTGGFYHSKANGLGWHIEAGRRGGKISKRRPSDGA